MKKTNKLLAILLCLAMFISLLPTWALAEEELPAEAPAAELIQESVQEEPEAELPEQTTEPEVLAEEAPIYEEAVIEEPVEEVLPEPSEEVSPEETPDAEQSVTAEEPAVLPGTESADAEAEAAPTDVVVTEAVAEPEAQESAEETEAVPVKIVFAVTPENAELIVYTKDEYDEKTEIDPEEDGSYLLLPGEYFYTLTAEGYVGLEEEKLEVKPSEEPAEIELLLIPVQPEDDVENTEEATVEAAEEETATLMASSGTCGTNLTWNLDDEGTLTISGTGAMTNYSSSSNAPWYSYRAQIKKVTIEPGITSIGGYAFYYCNSLTSVAIPDSVTGIGSYAFYNCSQLSDVYYGGARIQWEEIVRLSSNDPLYNATIHYEKDFVTGTCGDNLTWTLDNEGLLIITGTGSMSYYYSTSVPWYFYRYRITMVIIEDGVTSISSNSFYSCTALTSITIPESVKSIGSSAFYGCNQLTDVYYGGSMIQWRSIDLNSNEPLENASIHYGKDIVTGTCGQNLTWVLDDEGTLAISGTGLMSNYDSYSDLPWYSYRSQIKKVTINEGVTSVGAYAFYECNSLTSTEIPESVTSIGRYAFYNCSGLTSIEIPAGVTSIGYNAFYNCSGLTRVTIPESVTSIGDYAFNGCSQLKSAGPIGNNCNIEFGWTHVIPSDAFNNCNSLTNMEIPAGITSIGSSAFSGCSGLMSITIPEGVTSIGYSAFSGCSGLTSITIPEGVTSIGSSTFSGCRSLTSIEIPESVTSIGYDAFYNCNQLSDVYYGGSKSQWENISKDTSNNPLNSATVHYAKEIATGTCGENLTWELNDSTGVLTISGTGTMWEQASLLWNSNYVKKAVIEPGITSIGYGAFSGCTELTEITIPASIESIESYAFDGCSSLQDVYFGGSEARKNYLKNKTDYNYGASTNTALYNATWHYAEGEEGWDQCGPNVWWKYDATTRTMTIKGEGDMWTFSQEEYSSQNYPAPWADYAGRVVGVTIEEGVTSISDACFYGFSKAKEISVPSSVRSVGRRAFYNCSSLTGVRLPADMTEIGDYLFYGCSSLESVEIPSTVTTIGYDAFYNCSSLQSITIPDGVTSIGGYAFSNCSSLTKVVIPNVTSYGYSPFSGCSGLKTAGPVGGGYDLEFYWTNEIPEYAMSGCNGLKLVVLPDAVTKINRYAFSGCYGLEEITIPANVKEIGEYAFSWCNNLHNIYFLGGTPDNISNDSFNGVTATAYYPGDGSWWEEDLLDYGGELTWVAVSQSRVRYNANGGSGAPAAQDKTYGVPLTLSTTVPTRESCTFLGWSRNQDATEGVYQPGDLFYGEGEVTLYAIWNRQIPIDAAHFPDENFRKYVKTFEQKNDGFLNDEEIRNVREIVCENKSIASLNGIEYFDQLLWLNISSNRITNLDLSGCRTLRSLNCNNNRLTSLDLSGLTDLEYLYCSQNDLTSLDISGCVQLINLGCYGNKISNLNPRNCTRLKSLNCNSNKLTALDVSNCTDLTELYCGDNQISSLDVSKLTELNRLICSNNKISTLNVTNCTELTQLECMNNQISALNVSKMTELQYLYCSGNKIFSLDVSKNTKLVALGIQNNQIREINVTNCPNLEGLYAFRNQLTKLDITKNTKLNALSCVFNNINELDLRSSADLVDIVRNGTRHENSNNGAVWYETDLQSRFVEFDTKTKIQPTIFSDNGDPDAYFHDAVYWAVDKGITSGKTATTFAPYDSCTRAQVMAFLWKAMGSPEVSAVNPFTDVKESDYFYKAVLWAVSQGITSGTSATTFSPYNTCTRAQVMSFLWKAKGSPVVGGSNPFTDVKESDYFYNAVLWAVSQGITSGTSATTFGPYNTCRRAQVMTFLYKAMG